MFNNKKKRKPSEESNCITNNYKFYDRENQGKTLKKKDEIQVILKSDHLKKKIIILYFKNTLQYLSKRIGEAFEKFHEFENLDDLRAINLSKTNEKCQLISIPSEGIIKDYISEGDIIYFDLTSNDLWLNSQIKINWGIQSLVINLKMKLYMEISIKKLMLIFLKLGLNIFIDYSLEARDKSFYLIKDLNLKTLNSKIDMNIDLNEINKEKALDNCKKNFK
jgi:hypothetical protein